MTSVAYTIAYPPGTDIDTYRFTELMINFQQHLINAVGDDARIDVTRTPGDDDHIPGRLTVTVDLPDTDITNNTEVNNSIIDGINGAADYCLTYDDTPARATDHELTWWPVPFPAAWTPHPEILRFCIGLTRVAFAAELRVDADRVHYRVTRVSGPDVRIVLYVGVPTGEGLNAEDDGAHMSRTLAAYAAAIVTATTAEDGTPSRPIPFWLCFDCVCGEEYDPDTDETDIDAEAIQHRKQSGHIVTVSTYPDGISPVVFARSMLSAERIHRQRTAEQSRDT